MDIDNAPAPVDQGKLLDGLIALLIARGVLNGEDVKTVRANAAMQYGQGGAA